MRRTVTFPGFLDAIDAVVQIARVAEALDHHPDIDVRWRTVRLSVTTHDAGDTLTDRDIALARAIEQLLAQRRVS